MGVEVRKIQSKRELRVFIRFPHMLYRSSPNWVPPMDIGELWTFDREKNPSFKHGDADFFLAYKNGEVVGRVAALVNYRANAKSGLNYARFGWIDFVNDYEVSAALLKAVENWAKEKGLTGVHGPFGLTDYDYEGMLIEGFENPGGVTVIYNYPYYPVHLARLGYDKADDWLQFKLPGSQSVPKKVDVVRRMVDSRYKLRAVFPRTGFQYRRLVRQMMGVVNLAFANLYGFVEYTPEEAKFFADNSGIIARYNLSCFIVDEHDNMVAFAIIMPSQVKAFQRSKGKLFPFGIFRIWAAKYFFKDVELTLMGVHPDWQNKGVHALLHAKLNEMFIRRKVRYAITNPQLETNVKAIGVWNNYLREQYTRRRCFVKKLD